MSPSPLDALRAVLACLGPYLTAKGGGLAWRGPQGLLTAADREFLAGAPREAILAVLEGREILSPSAAPPEPIEAGPYAGFLAGPPGREPDPVRRAIVMLERLAYQLDTVRRDGRRRDAQAARTAKAPKAPPSTITDPQKTNRPEPAQAPRLEAVHQPGAIEGDSMETSKTFLVSGEGAR